MPTTADLVLSQVVATDLVVYRGDSGRFRVTVTDPDGLPVDVSAAVWLCEIRRSPDDASVVTSLIVSPTAGDAASVDVILTAAASALIAQSAVWDLQMTLGGEVQTLLGGRVVITRDVSR